MPSDLDHDNDDIISDNIVLSLFHKQFWPDRFHARARQTPRPSRSALLQVPCPGRPISGVMSDYTRPPTCCSLHRHRQRVTVLILVVLFLLCSSVWYCAARERTAFPDLRHEEIARSRIETPKADFDSIDGIDIPTDLHQRQSGFPWTESVIPLQSPPLQPSPPSPPPTTPSPPPINNDTMVWYNSTCLDITSLPTPDPWITYHPATTSFYLTFTANDRIPLWDTKSLMNLYDRPNRGPIYHANPSGPISERLWAPELHLLRGRWYIYFAAADEAVGNRSHRMYVLGGPPGTANPHEGPWELLGPIKGMDQRQWAIDGTVFEVNGILYFVYSGWPEVPGYANRWEDRREGLQQLFILKLQDPVTATKGAEPVMISHPSFEWERMGGGGPAINEGAQWLESPRGDWRGLVYSCSASWTKEYKMATLQFLGGDPLDPSSWRKGERPLLQNRLDGLGPYGPGHGCFLHAGGETVALFHATDRPTDGNQNRRCRMQRVRWTSRGPDMGGYVGVSTTDRTLFLQGINPDVEGGPGDGVLHSLVHALVGVPGT